MADTMFMTERRQAILERLQREGRVTVVALSESLGVSTVTIRQDLRVLEEAGHAERTYGGAVVRNRETLPAELSFAVRRRRHVAEKAAIGVAAAALVHDGDGIALDASTTSFAIAAHLKGFDSLTIVTNSLMVTQQFLDTPRIRVLVPGGEFRRDSVSLVGEPGRIPDVNLRLGFFGAHGLSVEAGAADVSTDIVTMRQAFMARCQACVVVVDGSKWGRIAPYTYARVDEIDRVITDTSADAGVLAAFKARGLQIDVIQVNEGEYDDE